MWQGWWERRVAAKTVQGNVGLGAPRSCMVGHGRAPRAHRFEEGRAPGAPPGSDLRAEGSRRARFCVPAPSTIMLLYVAIARASTMKPDLARSQDEIAELMLHIERAARDSPCTCADLDAEAMLEIILDNGMDPNTRIARFLELSRATEARLRDAVYGKMRDPALRPLLIKTFHQHVPTADIGRRNAFLNHAFQECGLSKIVQAGEQVAVAYTALLRYLWPRTTTLTRFVEGESESRCMLESMQFFSTGHTFVSTSMTRSPWFEGCNTFYSIRVTDAYRKHAVPVSYTSAFAINSPETLDGATSYLYFEDEVRLENGTPITPGTVDVTFILDAAAPKSRIDALVSRYSPLGTVRIRSP